MQVSVADAGTLRKQLTITFDADEVKSREAKLLERYAGQMNVKGFRKGKVPAALVKQRFGQTVRGEVQDALSNEGLQQAMSEHDLKPVGPLEPESNEITDDGLTLVASFDVQPEFELPDPTSIEVPTDDTAASADEIQEEIDGLARRSGEHQELDAETALAKDDAITLTGKLTAGDEVVREIQDLNHLVGAYPLFGTEPDAVVALVEKLKVGEALEFDTTLPETFKPEAHAGKDVHVSVTIQKAQRLVPATIDEDFAKKLGTESVEQLTERVEQMITSRKEQELHGKRIEAMIEQLLEKSTFDLPPKLVSDLIEQRVEGAVAQAKQQDPEADEAKTRSEAEAEAKDAVEKELRQHLITERIASVYQVQATQQDLQQQITMAAYQSGRQPQEVAKQLQESGQLMQVMADIRQHKSVETMLAKVLEAHGIGEAAEAETAEA